MIKRTVFLFLVIACGITISSFETRKNSRSDQKVIRTIIVDAGHGIMDNGGHNGAKGAYSYEDEICLDISKELIRNFQIELPDVRIVETRPTDKITALHRRAKIANEN